MERRELNRKAVSWVERGSQCLAVALCAALVSVELVKAELRLPPEHRLDILEAQYAMVVLADPPALVVVPAPVAAVVKAAIQHMACLSGRWKWHCITVTNTDGGND